MVESSIEDSGVLVDPLVLQERPSQLHELLRLWHAV